MCGYPGKVSALATRVSGSSDLYGNGGRRPWNSINFVTSHDGFTLADLVSYNEKHNLENGEDNQDGENYNISWNTGVEGPTGNKEILMLRARRIRTMAVILLLSQGVPMLVAGDEFGRTQKGNNNPWCQDNETGWLDWRLLGRNRDQFEFFRKLIRLRREHPVFRRHDFFTARHPENDPLHRHEIIWQGLEPGFQDWSEESKTLGFTLNGSCLPEDDDDFFIMLNGHRREEVNFTIPRPPSPHRLRIWKEIVNTGRQPPGDFTEAPSGRRIAEGASFVLAPMGCAVLQSIAQNRT
jgi:glycogen operon protein